MPLIDHRLPTVAEASDYRKTSTSAEVLDFLLALDERSSRAHLTELGRTAEDRPIPLLILTDPPVTTVEAARESGKLIAFTFGNIHVGEVDGKERAWRSRARSP